MVSVPEMFRLLLIDWKMPLYLVSKVRSWLKWANFPHQSPHNHGPPVSVMSSLCCRRKLAKLKSRGRSEIYEGNASWIPLPRPERQWHSAMPLHLRIPSHTADLHPLSYYILQSNHSLLQTLHKLIPAVSSRRQRQHSRPRPEVLHLVVCHRYCDTLVIQTVNTSGVAAGYLRSQLQVFCTRLGLEAF